MLKLDRNDSRHTQTFKVSLGWHERHESSTSRHVGRYTLSISLAHVPPRPSFSNPARRKPSSLSQSKHFCLFPHTKSPLPHPKPHLTSPTPNTTHTNYQNVILSTPANKHRRDRRQRHRRNRAHRPLQVRRLRHGCSVEEGRANQMQELWTSCALQAEN